MAMFDIESFGLGATYFGANGKALPEKQPVFKALATKCASNRRAFAVTFVRRFCTALSAFYRSMVD